jgi:D-3-phosphoglycerate dehydrogenase / 2-oxoglutarate reductase
MRGAVQITTSTFAEGNPELLTRLRDAGLEVRTNPFGRRLTRDEAVGVLTDDVLGLLAGLEPLGREVLGRSSLKVVSRVGSGLSNVDLDAAAELGITVCNTPNGPTTAVAELTLGALLALLREIPAFDTDLHAGTWQKRTGGELAGRTVAIIGLGRIGLRVSELCHAFGAEVLGVDPVPRETPSWIQMVSLMEAVPRADVFCVHAAGEDCIIGASEFERMRPGCLVLNAARGGVVDEAALAAALESGHLGGAWLDVFMEEPYTGPLCGTPRVLLTPHVGSYTRECRVRMESHAVDNLLSALSGQGV